MIKTEPDGKRWTLHSPGADLDYSVDWSLWLDDGEVVVTSSWAATSGITLARQALIDGNLTTTFAAGGVEGQNYILTNTITTNQNRIDSRTITLRCRLR